MSQSISLLEPWELSSGQFLDYVATTWYQGKKPKDVAQTIEGAILPGLILAKRQPELMDAAVKYWDLTRGKIMPGFNADSFVTDMITVYHLKGKR
jgi:hypothetical protein